MSAVVYNRKTVAEAGLEDPAELYADGNWTWDTFQDMLEKFVRYPIIRNTVLTAGGLSSDS